MNTETIKKSLERELSNKRISAWDKGVIQYAFELLDNIDDIQKCNEGISLSTVTSIKKELLNGASNWTEYSYGGCSLIYNYDIAKRLCTPSEFKKKKEGELNPNSQETWLDVQSRALYQAFRKITRFYEG